MSSKAHLGFGLAFGATLAAALFVDFSSSATSYDDAPWAPWLIASFLGTAVAVILTTAEGALQRTRWVLTTVLVVTMPATFVLSLPLLSAAASLAEGL